MPELDLDTAMKRYAEGDRSPEVLAALNEAADQTFDFPPLEAQEPPDLEPWKLDLGLVLPLAFERLLPWVKEENGYLPYLQPERNRLQVRFNYSPKNDRQLFLTISITGKEDDILRFLVESDKRVAPGDLDRAFRFVNDWNRQTRWPKAVVAQEYLDQEEGGSLTGEARAERERTHSAALRLEAEVSCTMGIHQAGLENLLKFWLSATWEFWEDAYQRWNL